MPFYERAGTPENWKDNFKKEKLTQVRNSKAPDYKS